jgi:hypothetical protein
MAVSASVLDMSMSLDGYIADPDDFLGGDDGERLHNLADADGESGQPAGQFQSTLTPPTVGLVVPDRELVAARCESHARGVGFAA